MMATLHPVNWELVLLKEDPFPAIPPRDAEKVVWAGFKQLRKQLDSLFVEALTTSRTQLVMNWGTLGSGKTHAATFFSKLDRLPAVEGQHTKDPLFIYIRTPKEPEHAEMQLYLNIIEAFQFRRLREVIQGIIAEYGRDGALEKLQKVAESESLGRALWLMGLERSRARQLTLFGETEASQEWQRLLEANFFSQTTRGELKQLGLSRGIDNAQDRFRILGGLIQSLIGFEATEKISQHHRVFLWIDEMEDLIYYATKYYRPFTQGLRDLIDRLPNYFTLLMNFTLASPEALEDATTVLGKTLVDRVTNTVYFSEPTQGEALEYVLELLSSYRTEDPQTRGLTATYPFTEETLVLQRDFPNFPGFARDDRLILA